MPNSSEIFWFFAKQAEIVLKVGQVQHPANDVPSGKLT